MINRKHTVLLLSLLLGVSALAGCGQQETADTAATSADTSETTISEEAVETEETTAEAKTSETSAEETTTAEEVTEAEETSLISDADEITESETETLSESETETEAAQENNNDAADTTEAEVYNCTYKLVKTVGITADDILSMDTEANVDRAYIEGLIEENANLEDDEKTHWLSGNACIINVNGTVYGLIFVMGNLSYTYNFSEQIQMDKFDFIWDENEPISIVDYDGRILLCCCEYYGSGSKGHENVLEFCDDGSIKEVYSNRLVDSDPISEEYLNYVNNGTLILSIGDEN